MRFEERIIEVVDSADFYFDPVTKMITKEYHKDYVALAVKGEYSSPRYIKHVYLFLEAANDRRAFDHCKSFEDLRNVNI
ncbi:hypothetical protein OEA42_004020 [Vibrio parahaemolyticus]|uniref:hypothetical protein n=2 Tax=Vibrio TaxID=662 RepID=UPI00165DBA6D|nr:hypothetical protein [Vibrio vulnificus]EJX5614678.1 hypothetical protein [Vibrio parahaemolyticus]EJB0234250.1 hypothetical protein [Vibrio vulnificus]EKA3724181.1 hypothetical protein [Vibrio vulnificus]ELQ3743176.1 hypothetical protein [Vibrio vulnificus]ELS5841790.1 hypothetical protein [Vibrio vulnificus]